MPRNDGRSAALLALIFGLLIFGLATLKGGIIALAIPPAVYLAAALLGRRNMPRVSAVRTLSSGHVAPGQEVTVTLVVTISGDQGIGNSGQGSGMTHGTPNRRGDAGTGVIGVQDMIPDGLELTSGDADLLTLRQPLTFLPDDGVVSLSYTIRGTRGEFAFRDVVVSLHDESGVFLRVIIVTAPATLLIRPNLRKLRPIVLHPPRTRGFAGPIPARQSGSGVDFFGMRQYQLGDRLRWINWRVSARHERRLYTNEFEQERIADIGIILDARAQTDVRTPAGSLYDHSIQAATALSDMLLDQGNRVGLLIYGRGREGVFPGYGNGQRERIFRALGRTASGHNYALESLNHLPVRFFPSGSEIIFIGSLTGVDDISVLTRMRANGYGVMALSPNPIAFEAASVQADARAVSYARRIAEVERRLATVELRRVGIQVIDWVVDRPLDQTLHESLTRQPAQSRPLVGGAR